MTSYSSYLPLTHITAHFYFQRPVKLWIDHWIPSSPYALVKICAVHSLLSIQPILLPQILPCSCLLFHPLKCPQVCGSQSPTPLKNSLRTKRFFFLIKLLQQHPVIWSVCLHVWYSLLFTFNLKEKKKITLWIEKKNQYKIPPSTKGWIFLSCNSKRKKKSYYGKSLCYVLFQTLERIVRLKTSNRTSLKVRLQIFLSFAFTLFFP